MWMLMPVTVEAHNLWGIRPDDAGAAEAPRAPGPLEAGAEGNGRARAWVQIKNDDTVGHALLGLIQHGLVRAAHCAPPPPQLCGACCSGAGCLLRSASSPPCKPNSVRPAAEPVPRRSRRAMPKSRAGFPRGAVLSTGQPPIKSGL